VTAQVCSTRSAPQWTRECSCGETPSTSIHRKATETKIATEARAVVQLFIASEFLAEYQNPQDYFFENPGGGSALLSDLFPHR
jgi:hypothetical protein